MTNMNYILFKITMLKHGMNLKRHVLMGETTIVTAGEKCDKNEYFV